MVLYGLFGWGLRRFEARCETKLGRPLGTVVFPLIGPEEDLTYEHASETI